MSQMGTIGDEARARATVELIRQAVEADNAPLAVSLFESIPDPALRDRIAAEVRAQLRPGVRLSRSRRV